MELIHTFLFGKGKGLIERRFIKNLDTERGRVNEWSLFQRVYKYILYGKILVIPLVACN